MADTLVMASWSANNREVFELSLPTHREYCAGHGYDLENIEESYNPYIDTARLRERLRWYRVVAVIGTDVLIRRPEIPLDTFVRRGVAMCPQHGDGVLNGDFMVFNSGGDTFAILAQLDAVQHRFEHGQAALNYLYRRKTPGIHAVEYLQIAAPAMNPGVDYSGVDLDRYFSWHFHAMGIAPMPAVKAAAMRDYLTASPSR